MNCSLRLKELQMLNLFTKMLSKTLLLIFLSLFLLLATTKKLHQLSSILNRRQNTIHLNSKMKYAAPHPQKKNLKYLLTNLPTNQTAVPTMSTS